MSNHVHEWHDIATSEDGKVLQACKVRRCIETRVVKR